MKKANSLLISLLLMISGILTGTGTKTDTNATKEDSLIIVTGADLAILSHRWASEYNRLNPGAKIKIVETSDVLSADKLIAEGHIGFVSDDFTTGTKNQSLWKVVVARDIIVPVINSKNPFAEEISENGISMETFAKFFSGNNFSEWGTLLKNQQVSPVRYFWINNESIKECLAAFLNTAQVKITGTEVSGGAEMISAIQKDPNALGFCRMIDIQNSTDQNISENIRLIPIDRNGNGTIDYNENIYNDLNSFSRGVWIGKYPKTLFSNIYSVSSFQPKNENEVAFLKWILTDGQGILLSNGFSELIQTERQSTVDKLYDVGIYSNSPPVTNSLFRNILYIIGIVTLTFLIVGSILRNKRTEKTVAKVKDKVYRPLPDENSMLVPKGLYFDKTHTWAFMEQNGIVKVGIDDFLQHITGTITRIKLIDTGTEVKKGEQILSIIQNGKQLNLYAPVSGIIKERNILLDSNSAIINDSPYSEGWIYRIEPTNWFRDAQLLFMAEKHRQFLVKEFSRLKDFLANTLSTDNEKYAQVVLQDGGELRDGILSELGPEVWDDFQTKFIDPSRQVWFYELF